MYSFHPFCVSFNGDVNSLVCWEEIIIQSAQRIISGTTIKVYTGCLKLDIEYKTLGIQWDTTSKDVVTQILRKCKMRQRDSRLFYLSMEVTVRKAGVKRVLKLDDDARPGVLAACHPKGDSRFCLQIKPGGLVRVHTSVLQPTSLYKCLFISEETTTDDLLTLLLSCFNLDEPVEQFSLYEVCPSQESQRKLHEDDYPLRVQMQRAQRSEQFHFIVRKNLHYPRRRQLLPSSIDNKTTKTNAENANTRRYTTNKAACHKNCVRELSFAQLTRVPTTDNLNQNECHLDDDVKSKKTLCINKYQPVYNIREISTVCNSFSSLGLGWKMDRGTYKTSPNSTSHNATNRHSMISSSNLNIVREAVKNNPSLGYGSYVYI
ncbi:uncharacterized protein LOC116346408 isoform X2 [Contarinia nasturtii]|uniref:uncharacterized protein LOC116346408 isoform X2 n=1 Tax=Contarinia nasturtii TaxID=265458 RepID=UPI0012D4A245|nr:uncharacterized protein LOC116346408 isoform X2 [Contarinia nasturtii]